MVSFRGALALKERLDLPSPPPSPCGTCEAKPCLTACPVGALTVQGYDLHACHAFLDTDRGEECMGQGCAVRRACPVSARHARMPEQSAYHMRQFHR
jgi:Fe-S-cluster-containing hydrogenase component 2